MSAVVILASARADGNTRSLVGHCFPAGMVSMEDLSQLQIGYYRYDSTNAGDDFLPLIERLLQHDTWWLATPLYWYTMSAQAKTFFDRFTDLITTHKALGRQLRGKKLGVLCCGSGDALPPHFDEPFALTCAYLGMEFLGSHFVQYDENKMANAAALLTAAKTIRSRQ